MLRGFLLRKLSEVHVAATHNSFGKKVALGEVEEVEQGKERMEERKEQEPAAESSTY